MKLALFGGGGRESLIYLIERIVGAIGPMEHAPRTGVTLAVGLKVLKAVEVLLNREPDGVTH